jgi:hypothetical protein
MMIRIRSWLLVVLAGAPVGGCAGVSEEVPARELQESAAALTADAPGPAAGDGAAAVSSAAVTDPHAAAPAPTRSIPVEARVPDTLYGQADCAQASPAPSACEWRDTVDAVVLGTVRSVRLVTAKPLARTQRGWEPAASCKLVHPALTFAIDVEARLSGTAPASVQVMVGAEQVQRFRPLPLLHGPEGLHWALQRGSEHGPLRKGTRVVAGLAQVDGKWSLMGGALFGVDSEGILHAPPRSGDCMNMRPEALDGAAVADLAQVFGACGVARSSRGEQRRASVRRVWGARPVRHSAPACVDPPAGDLGEDAPAPAAVHATTEHTGGPEPVLRP